MNTKQKIILPIVVLVLICATLFILKQRSGHVGQFPEDMPPFTYPTDDKAKDAAPAAGFLPTKMENPARFEAWSKNVSSMGQCLGVEVAALDPQQDMTVEVLGKLLIPSFGEVSKIEDKWLSIDYKTKYGEVRRLFAEYDRNPEAPEAAATRTVRHYSMLVTGNVRDIPLKKELRDNPTDAEIGKLFSDSKVVTETKSKVAAFKNDDELHFVETNGKLYSFVVSHLGKYFRCKNADTEKMSCSCN